ncbi:hypothetical protein Y015_02280 [Chlamydia muridarum str. Nigg CM972]|nr:hypothetical protein TAC_02280 [Chlamydia muridarum str. Nigg3 CMUT3-5]AHH23748.1 hypothetical protein Y015_02280 [Chlamydia muridarum str. Nigg CM972]
MLVYEIQHSYKNALMIPFCFYNLKKILIFRKSGYYQTIHVKS